MSAGYPSAGILRPNTVVMTLWRHSVSAGPILDTSAVEPTLLRIKPALGFSSHQRRYNGRSNNPIMKRNP
jgi:hypothetical protein